MRRTCFWGGDAFAPQLKIKSKDGTDVPVQQFLQDAFLNMWELVVKTLTDLDCVIGFDVGFLSVRILWTLVISLSSWGR